jgi:amino acid adenylation domain-containing protein
MKFNALLRRIQEEAAASEPYHYHPLAKIQADSQLKQNLIDHLYVFENLPLTEQIEGYGVEKNQSDQFPLKLTNTELFDQTNYDLNIVLSGTDRLEIKFKYNGYVYPSDYIERIAGHFLLAFRQVIENEELEIGTLTLISEEEKNRLLYEFNNTASGYPSDKTIHELFEEQAAQRPDGIAIVGPSLAALPLREIHEPPTQVTYRELNERSNGFAHWLKLEGVEPDTIVGILVERSLEMIIGILGILKAGGAYLPIPTDYPWERINYILADSGAKIIVTTEYPANKVSAANCQLLLINSQPEEPVANLSEGLRFPPAAGNLHPQLAYIIYTSGTSGKPKGMLIEHRNVVRLMTNDRFLFDFNHRDVWTMFHSYCFDFSVWEMYGALLYGGRLIMVPGTMSKDIIAYRELLIKQQVTILNQTPSAFYHLAEIETFQYRKSLNIRVVIFGGEALNPVKLKKWKDKYPETKLVNMYGITETTVHVTYKEIGDKEIEFNISNIGKPIPTLNVYAVDTNQFLLPIGTSGELWVGGDGVGRGYLNRPELTAEKFFSSPYRDGERIYRSGDLVRWQLDEGDGEMVYMGRIDRQEKIRGFRVEPEEIETQLLKHESINEAVVIAGNEENGLRYLCAYMVPDTDRAVVNRKIPTPADWREFLSRALPEYMIPSYFIPIDKVPLTPNGKLDRRALPAPEPQAKKRIAPRNELERQLLEIWSEVLKVEKEKISIDSNFFDLGGHSLNATIVITKLHKAFNAKVPLVELFKTPTIQELAKYIKGLSSAEDRFSHIRPVEKKEYYPMSSGQRRMFTVQQMHRENVFANSTIAFKLEGAVDRQKFEEAFHKLIQRHESLKTSFFITGQEYRQKVHVDVPFKLEYTEVQHLKFPWEEASKIMGKFVRPFTLELTPLFRVGLVKVEKERFVLMIDMHHIITDGTSMKVFLGDLMALYDGQTLPPLPVQYKEFAHWQDQFIESGGMDLQKTYWLKVFEKAPPELNLSTDFPRPDRLTAAGGFLTFRIDEEDINAIRTMASQQDVTAFMILLAAFNVLLAKDSGEEDIVVGSPVASRRHEDSLKIIGIFSNFLALRNFPNKEKTFGEFLQEVKENTLAAFENQDYPFEELAKDEAVNPNRNPGRTPLFDVVFAFQNLRIPKVEIAGIQLKPFESKSKTARYDLEFQCFETENSLEFTVSYRVSLFREETVKRLIDSFKTILKQIPGSTDIKLAEIEIMTADEKNQVTLDFNIEKEREYDF